MPASSVEVDTRVLDRIVKNLPGNRADNVRAIAFNVEGKSKVNAPIDTGALRNSHYTRTYQGDWQNGTRTAEGMVQARIKGFNKDAVFVPLPKPRNDGEAIVGASVNYAIDVHYGTTKQTGRPYLAEAVRAAESELRDAARRIVTDSKR